MRDVRCARVLGAELYIHMRCARGLGAELIHSYTYDMPGVGLQAGRLREQEVSRAPH